MYVARDDLLRLTRHVDRVPLVRGILRERGQFNLKIVILILAFFKF